MHSLRPDHIHSEMQGAKLLRRYLEFMQNAEVSIEGLLDPGTQG